MRLIVTSKNVRLLRTDVIALSLQGGLIRISKSGIAIEVDEASHCFELLTM